MVFNMPLHIAFVHVSPWAWCYSRECADLLDQQLSRTPLIAKRTSLFKLLASWSFKSLRPRFPGNIVLSVLNLEARKQICILQSKACPIHWPHGLGTSWGAHRPGGSVFAKTKPVLHWAHQLWPGRNFATAVLGLTRRCCEPQSFEGPGNHPCALWTHGMEGGGLSLLSMLIMS